MRARRFCLAGCVVGIAVGGMTPTASAWVNNLKEFVDCLKLCSTNHPRVFADLVDREFCFLGCRILLLEKNLLCASNCDPVEDGYELARMRFSQNTDAEDGFVPLVFESGPYAGQGFERLLLNGVQKSLIEIDDLDASDPITALTIEFLAAPPASTPVTLGTDTNGLDGWAISLSTGDLTGGGVLIVSAARESDPSEGPVSVISAFVTQPSKVPALAGWGTAAMLMLSVGVVAIRFSRR